MDMRSAVQLIKEKISLADIAGRYVDLRRHGARLMGPCPFHQETKPSFCINEERGLFYCFGCQASGDLIEFYGRINGLEFHETITQLAEEVGISIDWLAQNDNQGQRRKNAKAMHLDASRHFISCLRAPAGEECRAYLARRGISPEIIEQFGLGWAERSWNSLQKFLQNLKYDLAAAQEAGLLSHSERGTWYDRFRGRLMFPIRDLANQVIAFGGRIIGAEDEAKYINSADTPIYSKKDHLYGLAQARKDIITRGFALLTEGYMDVLTLHQFGFKNSVGVLGTALTPEQIQRLSGFTSRIVLVFDGDRAGRAAAQRSAELLLMRGLSCQVIALPDGEDIDSHLRKVGADGLEALISEATDGLRYCLNTVKALSPRDAIAWGKNFLERMQVPELVSPYASAIAQGLGIAEDKFREALNPHTSGCEGQLPLSRLCERDTQIMLYAVRYPDNLQALREIGADLALTNPRSQALWDIISKYGQESVYYLDERQKSFWHKQRGPGAPPCNNPELELECLKESLDRFYTQSQLAALSAAMRSSPHQDFELDLQYLQAAQNAMRKSDE